MQAGCCKIFCDTPPVTGYRMPAVQSSKLEIWLSKSVFECIPKVKHKMQNTARGREFVTLLQLGSVANGIL